MQTVQAIIAKAGGWERLKKFPIQVTNGIHMPLIIEYLGRTGFNGSDLFRVMQLETVEGKSVIDTEITFECDPDGENWQGVVWYSELTGEKQFAYISYDIMRREKVDPHRYESIGTHRTSCRNLGRGCFRAGIFGCCGSGYSGDVV